MRTNIRAALFVALTVLCVCAGGNGQEKDTSASPVTSAKAPPPQARVDINRASMDELLKVPGMTRSWAGRIVRYRPYKTKADLVEQGVVTTEVYERIKDNVIAHRE